MEVFFEKMQNLDPHLKMLLEEKDRIEDSGLPTYFVEQAIERRANEIMEETEYPEIEYIDE